MQNDPHSSPAVNPSANTRTDEHDPALELFLQRFALDLSLAPFSLLRSVLRGFSRFPYENLTKIIADAAAGCSSEARRSPFEVVRDQVQYGAGGTCFSLTATLRHLLRTIGFEAEPILADRPYGPDTHCALIVRVDDRPYLVDPGYLLTEPVALPEVQDQHIETSFHALRLAPRHEGRVDLYTRNSGRDLLRITFKTDPVDWGTFLRAWDSSFDWEMMRYPVITQVIEGRHVYLQGNRLQTRRHEGVNRTEIAPNELAAQIAATFGMDVALVEKALALLRQRG